jgi:hypothetical protein
MEIPTPARIGVVGGGLFPRSLIILKKIFPYAQLEGIEADQKHIDIARRFVDAEFIHDWFDPAKHRDFDLLIIPLAYLGDRQQLYDNPVATRVLIHDWLWRKRGPGAIVSIFLLKRINLVTR